MFDLTAFVKPLLAELTGQDIRAWSSGPCSVRANWQIPDGDSRAWAARTLEIQFSAHILRHWSACDRSTLCQQQRALDRVLRGRLGLLGERSGADGVIVLVVDDLSVA
ncbi:hypothetical protein CURE108131_05135 [Cupriavidus respiraculi]|uniref:DUF3168 domain-containing protein n=1 Tax=Cupriavidus respiraculi TaxID=195930 RepID=A0ABN7YX46_9BURK|nr:hypothetical protein [Cupriavidus respiraculi]CAG9178037.1 hypothetical protein LMG21510_03466 [Cupriavidus respiraculi]